jgi:ABC-type multidrug transport system fused ATPase/permease subunit
LRFRFLRYANRQRLPRGYQVTSLSLVQRGSRQMMNSYVLLFRDLIRRLGWRFPTLILWMALVGLGEGISVVLLLPLLNRMGIPVAGGQGMVINLLDAGLSSVGATDSLVILGIIIAITAVQTALSIGLTWWTAKLTRGYQSERQVELFTTLMRANWSFLAGRKAGEMTSAILTECDRLGGASTIALSLMSAAVITVVYAALSIFVAWQVTIGLFVFALGAAVAMMRFFGTMSAIGQRLAPLNTALQSALIENFTGAKYIKAACGVGRATEYIQTLVRKLEKATVAASSMPGTIRSLLELLAFAGLAGILVLGRGWMDLAAGNVLVVLALFGRLFPRITTMQAQVHHLNWNVHAIEVINALQSAAQAQAERSDPSGAAPALRIDLPTTLAVRGLTVKFGERKALNGVDLELPMPGFTAVVGGSGAGKSTLVHTLLGLTEPSAGSVHLGNHDFASTSLSAWRGAIGYVPQETILFHASIRDNLVFANPAASAADVETAARRAHAHDFITALPEGYDAIIGDQGVKLSGGQRQRLGIARALLTNPRLLVLDEAMSALDAASELEILRTLDELRGQMGILLIAHRLAAVASADLIYVFDEGCVAESGTWDVLIACRGQLHALAAVQGFDRVAMNAGR